MENKFLPPRSIGNLAESIAMTYETTVTPLKQILEDEEIPYAEDDYGDAFDGMTVYDTSFFIHLNTSRGNHIDTPRGRFTMAHELAHCIIENHRKGIISGKLKPHPSKTNQSFHYRLEREADYFASCLLMPEFRFLKECLGKPFNFDLTKHISDTFQVSLTAAALRFALIGTHPIIVIYSKGSGIEWYFPSNDFPFKSLLDGKDSIPINTLMSDFFKDGKRYDEIVEIEAQDWFRIYRPQDNGRVFYEKCIYGPDGVISIIWEE